MDENKVPQCVFVDCLCKLDDPGSQFSTDNCGNLIPGAKHHPQYYLICGYCDHFLKSLHPKRILETEQYDSCGAFDNHCSYCDQSFSAEEGPGFLLCVHVECMEELQK